MELSAWRPQSCAKICWISLDSPEQFELQLDEETSVTIYVEYQWILKFCSKCKRFGRDQNQSKQPTKRVLKGKDLQPKEAKVNSNPNLNEDSNVQLWETEGSSGRPHLGLGISPRKQSVNLQSKFQVLYESAEASTSSNHQEETGKQEVGCNKIRERVLTKWKLEWDLILNCRQGNYRLKGLFGRGREGTSNSN